MGFFKPQTRRVHDGRFAQAGGGSGRAASPDCVFPGCLPTWSLQALAAGHRVSLGSTVTWPSKGLKSERRVPLPGGYEKCPGALCQP